MESTPFAHTIGANGPDVELLLVGGALLVLGIIFFLQKNTKPAVPVVLAIAALGFGAGAFAAGGSGSDESSARSSEGISLSIEEPADGSTVPADENVRVTVDLEGAEIAPHHGEAPPDSGHLHVFVDGALQDMPMTLTPAVELEPGEHEVAIEFVDFDHQPLDPPVVEEVEVTAE